jgi:hypothetical protein
MDRWEVNHRDGEGWQLIDEEAMRLEISDCCQLDFTNNAEGEVAKIETEHAKYRRTTVQDLPLSAPEKVIIEPDGNVWAI